MKFFYIIFALLLLNSNKVVGQLTDTTCLKSRSLSISRSLQNNFLFPTNIDDKQNILIGLLDLAAEDKINFYWKTTNSTSNDKKEIQFLQYLKDTNSGCKGCIIKEDWIKLILNFDPLTNSIGEDSVTFHPDGTVTITYPPTIILNFDLHALKNVLIKEKYIYTKEKNISEFSVSEIGFNIGSTIQGYQTFWVDMKELSFAMKTQLVYNWYVRLLNRDYQGFQFEQESCYD